MSDFRIVAVAGAGSGCGKTAVACRLLAELEGFAGIKASAGGMYTTVTDDPSTVGEPGKDTAMMNEAGAVKTVFISCPREEMEDALTQALTLAGDVRGAVVEGNSACMALEDTDLFVFVLGPPPYSLKPGSEEALRKADVVIVNEQGDEPSVKAVQLIKKYNGRATIQTIAAPLGGVLAVLL